MEISPRPQIPSNIWKQRYGSAHKYRLTLQCYDLLSKEGYRPSDMGLMMVTMRSTQFKKLLEQCTENKCSTKIIKNGRLSSVWWNQVEISCFEEHHNEYISWGFTENWNPL